jgi:CheY-like chemotaxis protein
MKLQELRVLVIDDSTMALSVALQQLHAAGHQAEAKHGSDGALELVRDLKPDVVICDIMMPGINGFELCGMIRADKSLDSIRIIMASAKAYDADRNMATKVGADGYIVKPFTLDKFNSIISSLDTMQLTAWGVRGTLPVPQQGFIRFGGNTSCYSLQFSATRHLVFDAGTGIKNCGSSMLKAASKNLDIDLLITHPHWDHINAFPFFAPLYLPGNSVRVHGCAQDSAGFEQLIVAQMDGTYFPVTVREFSANLSFNEIGEQELNLDGIQVRTMLLKHPGHCLGYRVDHGGRSFCYITDNELYHANSEFADEEFLHSLANFCRGTNVLIHDCTYSDEEYASKVHWGHSALSEVCRLANLAEAERLWIHHHDPSQDDVAIERKLEFCTLELQKLGSRTLAVLPSEGMREVV